MKCPTCNSHRVIYLKNHRGKQLWMCIDEQTVFLIKDPVKPCPFCGYEAFYDEEILTVSRPHAVPGRKIKFQKYHFIECLGENCFAIMRAKTKKEVFKQWNRRKVGCCCEVTGEAVQGLGKRILLTIRLDPQCPIHGQFAIDHGKVMKRAAGITKLAKRVLKKE